MIPRKIRLFTWVDVEDVLLHVRENQGWPEWLKSARAYWNLILEITPGNRAKAMAWLADIFAPRFVKDSILLESLDEIPRHLEVQIKENEDEPFPRRFFPSLNRPSAVCSCQLRAEPESFPKDYPPVIALHSFKGGVGRTIHAMAIAKAIADGGPRKRVLLIDADLEAPGITWALKECLPDPPVSFTDFLALVHCDPDPSAENTLRMIADRLRTSHSDRIYFLPAFRSTAQFTSLEIRPKHLIQAADDPYLITRALCRLGKMLGVSAIVIDLRSGISGFSTWIMLDPRAHRIMLTTLSAQSVEGTGYLLRLFEKLTPPQPGYPVPKVIFSQIPDSYMKEKSSMTCQIGTVENSAQAFWKTDSSENGHILMTPYEQSLFPLPQPWDEVICLLGKSELFDRVRERVNDWFPSMSAEESVPAIQAGLERGEGNIDEGYNHRCGMSA